MVMNPPSTSSLHQHSSDWSNSSYGSNNGHGVRATMLGIQTSLLEDDDDIDNRNYHNDSSDPESPIGGSSYPVFDLHQGNRHHIKSQRVDSNLLSSSNTAVWKQHGQPSLWGAIVNGDGGSICGTTTSSTLNTANSNSWQSWSDHQKDTSQHSRGSASIWATNDDYAARNAQINQCDDRVASGNENIGGIEQKSATEAGVGGNPSLLRSQPPAKSSTDYLDGSSRLSGGICYSPSHSQPSKIGNGGSSNSNYNNHIDSLLGPPVAPLAGFSLPSTFGQRQQQNNNQLDVLPIMNNSRQFINSSDSNSFDEDQYLLDSNLSHLSLSCNAGPFQNTRRSNFNQTIGISKENSSSLTSPLRRSTLNFNGSGTSQLNSAHPSVFQQPNNQTPMSPSFYSADLNPFPSLTSGSSVSSSIPGLTTSSSGSTSVCATSIVSRSKLNPNMTSWRPNSAPVGSPQKPSLSSTLATSRSGTPSPLSSVIAPPPLFQLELQRSSSSTISVGGGNNHMNGTGGATGSRTPRNNMTPVTSMKGGRDRQRSNRRKQSQHSFGGSLRQSNHLPSPQALKEVNNNYKSDLFPEPGSYPHSSSNNLLSPSHNRSRGPNYDLSSTHVGAESLILSSPLQSGASSEAIRALMKPQTYSRIVSGGSVSTPPSIAGGMSDPLDQSISSQFSYSVNDITNRTTDSYPILPQPTMTLDDCYPSYFADDISENGSEAEEDETFNFDDDFDLDDDSGSWDACNGNPSHSNEGNAGTSGSDSFVGLPLPSSRSKKREWLLRMNRKLQDIPVGDLDPTVMPLSAIMNAWAKTKSAQGASMVEMWLKRAQEECDAGNRSVVPTTKMYTMAVDAWARSGEGGAAAQRAEALLQHMHRLYQSGEHQELRPTNAIFNAVINAWARSREKIAPVRAEQILNWMQNLSTDLDIQPDKYTFNTVIHAWAKAGGTEAATKAQELLAKMHSMYQAGNLLAKPDTISYNVVINAWAKSGGKGAANEAEKLLQRMHHLHEMGDPDVKPNVVTYGAVIDSFAKSGERGAASRADTLLANMIQLHQSDPSKHSDLLPNTYVFNTVINCWAKSKEHDAASKAEEMLVAMSRLHAAGMPSLKPDNFTYTAVIDAWAKSGYKGAASRADQLLDKMESKYLAGDTDLKPNSYTYNAVVCALAKSGEPGAAARAERVLQNMVNRHRTGGDDDIKPTTINFNTVLDAWAKSRGGRAAAERAEEILEWMDRLHKAGNPDVKVDTISFNAVLDAWARSGDRVAPRRAEQILAHMDELYRGGNKGVKPDRYTYNTLINVWAKSGERGSAARAEHVLSVMEKRHRDGDQDFKPNTRTYTSVIDAWAKSGEQGAARRAEQILNNMISRYEAAGDPDVKPNVHTANAVCNACAFSKNEEDREEALQIAFRVFDWLANQSEMNPDSYTYTILLSVCANLLPRDDGATRYAHARAFFESCRDAGYVNDFVLRKLRQTVSEDEFLSLIDYRTDASASCMPAHWTRNAKLDPQNFSSNKGRKNGNWSNRRKGK